MFCDTVTTEKCLKDLNDKSPAKCILFFFCFLGISLLSTAYGNMRRDVTGSWSQEATSRQLDISGSHWLIKFVRKERKKNKKKQ